MTITELEQCIDLYGKDIFSFCRYATGSVQEGEELYQDTFLTAVEEALAKDFKDRLLEFYVRTLGLERK